MPALITPIHSPILNACGQEITDTDRHVKVKEAATIVSVSARTIENMVAAGQFPPKHNTSPGRVAFWLSELNEWQKLGCNGWYQRYGQKHLQALNSQKRTA